MTQPNQTERIAAAWAYHTMQQDWDSLSENARHLYESDVRDIRKALDVLGLEIVEKQADDQGVGLTLRLLAHYTNAVPPGEVLFVPPGESPFTDQGLLNPKAILIRNIKNGE